jgi:hypothetical protein
MDYLTRMHLAVSGPNAHVKISHVVEEPIDELLKALRDKHPDEYALLQEHLFVERHLDPREVGK